MIKGKILGWSTLKKWWIPYIYIFSRHRTNANWKIFQTYLFRIYEGQILEWNNPTVNSFIFYTRHRTNAIRKKSSKSFLYRNEKGQILDWIIPKQMMHTVLSFIKDVGKNPPNNFCLEMMKDRYWNKIILMETVLSFIRQLS